MYFCHFACRYLNPDAFLTVKTELTSSIIDLQNYRLDLSQTSGTKNNRFFCQMTNYFGL